MFIKSSHCHFHYSLPFIVTFCLIHVVTLLNPPSITSTLPQSIINYYTNCHTSIRSSSSHTSVIFSDLVSPKISLPLSSFLFSPHSTLWWHSSQSWSDFSVQHLHSQHSCSHQPTTPYCSYWSSSYNINQFALSETWITPSTTFSELFEATPPEFSLISTSRPVSLTNLKKQIVGGGTAFLIHNSSTIVSTSSEIFKSFELSSITIKLLKSKLTVFNIYRNHCITNTSSHDPVPFSDFLIDFQTFISTAATTPHEFLITGDFNIKTDNHSDLHSQQFLSLLNNADLTQHANFPTHRAGHTLDLVITTKDLTLSLTITHSLVSPSDHFLIFTSSGHLTSISSSTNWTVNTSFVA